jgi:hypothetical protein
MRRVVELRVVLSLAASAVAGAAGLRHYPFPGDHAILTLVSLERPGLYAGLTYTYATLWFSSAFFLRSLGIAWVSIFALREDRTVDLEPLPPGSFTIGSSPRSTKLRTFPYPMPR